MSKNLLVIGGSGFVGTRLLNILYDKYTLSNLDKKLSLEYPEITEIGDIKEIGQNKNIYYNKNTVVLLAAEHRDDVLPISLYYEVNVQGTRNVLDEMDINGITNIIFTSSVAVYGLNKKNPDEQHSADPFNHYGISKWQAEEVLRDWYLKDIKKRSLTILRPTVIFGERNRGNVFNLLKQIASGRFLMVGSGKNKKSMAYVGNVVAFIKHCIETQNPGYRIFNYVDGPDLNMNELVSQVEISLSKKIPALHLPYWVGYFGGSCLDILSKLTKSKFSISAVRVRKFCATTQFDATKAHNSGFTAPFTLQEGIHHTLQFEFNNPSKDNVVFITE